MNKLTSDDARIIVKRAEPYRAIDVAASDSEVAAAIGRLADNYGPDLIAVTWDELWAATNAHYITPATESDEATFDEMLNCLPPCNWRVRDGIESFTMSERLTGSLTSQYATDRKGRYLHKTVDLADRTTWINRADFARVFGDEGETL